jgi:hypothetical protein
MGTFFYDHAATHLSTVIRIKYNSAIPYKPKVTYQQRVDIVNYFNLTSAIREIIYGQDGRDVARYHAFGTEP